MDKNFPGRLKELMRSNGYTQESLAKAVGVKQQSIQYLLSGKAKGTRYIVQLAKALNTSVEHLQQGAEPASIAERAVEYNVSPDIQAITEMLSDMPDSMVSEFRATIQDEKQRLDLIYYEMLQKRRKRG
jgi:transcriptional regulator with XRE-family HTH domain